MGHANGELEILALYMKEAIQEFTIRKKITIASKCDVFCAKEL
jgi:hypothetical protein